MSKPDEQRIEHVEYQRRYFDKNCDVFRQPIPKEIEKRTRMIAASARLNSASHVLDVGTGMGALIKHFIEFDVKPKNVVGCDLSDKMLDEAKKRYPTANFWQGDVVDFPVAEYAPFNSVFFNACFGNIFDQQGAMATASAACAKGGRIVISHPLGNEFMQKLKQHDENLILTLMPERATVEGFCTTFGLELEQFTDTPAFYLAVMQKV